MARPLPHSPFNEAGAEHSPYLPGGGSGGGLTEAEVLEILAGTKKPGSIFNNSLALEIKELLGKGGPPSGAAGGVLSGTYPNPGLASEAVKTAAVQLLAITKALLAEESVGLEKIVLAVREKIEKAIQPGQSEAITTVMYKLLSVTTAILGEESVSTAKIKLLAITEGLIAAGAVSEGKLSAAVIVKLNEKGGSTEPSAPEGLVEKTWTVVVAKESYEFEWEPSATVKTINYVKVNMALAKQKAILTITVDGVNLVGPINITNPATVAAVFNLTLVVKKGAKIKLTLTSATKEVEPETKFSTDIQTY